MIIVFVLLNLFLAIVTNSFVKVRSYMHKNSDVDEMNLFKYLKQQICQLLPFESNKCNRSNMKGKQDKPDAASYKSSLDYFPENVDELVSFLAHLHESNSSYKH